MPFAVFRRSCLAIVILSTLVSVSAPADEPAAGDKPTGEITLKVEDIALTVPGDWKVEKPSNRLRLAQIVVPAAEGDDVATELVVSYFGGGGGGVDQNIERWVGQFAGEGKTAKVTQGTSKQGTYYFVDLNGTFNRPVGPPIQGKTEALSDARMLGVILQVEGKGNYFLKLAGPQKTVAAAEQALRKSFGGDEKTEKPYELK